MKESKGFEPRLQEPSRLAVVWTGMNSFSRLRPLRGQSLVEFAIAVPVLIALFSGTVDLGRVYYFQITVRDAARDGARALAGNYNGSSPSVTAICRQVQNDLADLAAVGCSETATAPPYAAGSDYTLPAANAATVLVYCGPFAAPATSACGNVTGGSIHNTVAVSVFYGFSTLTPLISSFAGSGGLIQLTGKTQMVSNW